MLKRLMLPAANRNSAEGDLKRRYAVVVSMLLSRYGSLVSFDRVIESVADSKCQKSEAADR